MTFASQNEPRSSHNSPRYLLGLLGCVVLPCGGCWEEIHYNPSKSPVAQSAEAESESIAEEELPGVPAPTSDELFGGVSESEATPDEVAISVQEESVVDQSPSEESLWEDRQPEAPDGDSIEDVFAVENGNSQEEPGGSQVAGEEESTAPTVPEMADALRPSPTALAAWEMSSQWSYAAAIYAKGLSKDFYGDLLQQATDAAGLIDIDLPEFPAVDGEDRQAAMIRFLLDAGRSQIAERLEAQYSPDYAALAELAIKTNVLLLVYTPKSQHLEPIVAAIRQAAENSTLPASIWTELVDLLEQRAPFKDVKAAVMSLHHQVGDYLSSSTEQ